MGLFEEEFDLRFLLEEISIETERLFGGWAEEVFFGNLIIKGFGRFILFEFHSTSKCMPIDLFDMIDLGETCNSLGGDIGEVFEDIGILFEEFI